MRDSGIGIAPEALAGIFDLFTQGERALDRPGGGLGVGLTIVRKIVELHGGTIQARSEGRGKGAEFEVRLPAFPAAEGVGHAAEPAEPVRRERVRLILLEDNPDAAESLTMLLELLGHHVRVFHDGVSALDAAGTNAPDVMLVDIGLPGIDGYEVARRARADGRLRDVILVALTGYGRAQDVAQARAVGFDYHLVKPVDVAGLERLLARFDTSNGTRAAAIH